uniref:DEP domain containing 4 n=1 Tax=Sphenodon punctatus TaxID=8508 RepID=A0A8D0GEX8_SPHPU
MAARLTPRFRRITSQSELSARRGVGRQRPGCTSPFQATRLWNGIIHALKTQVEIKKRRQHLRTYRNCFTGSNAVDVVLSHLMQSMYLSSSDISRLKGVRLCQALMDHKVFEPAGVKLFRNEKMVFDDTNNTLYRFPESRLSALVLKQNGDAENSSPTKITKPKTKRLSGAKHEVTMSNPLALKDVDKRIEELIQTINTHPSLPQINTVNEPFHLLSKRAIDEVWKQQTLLRLLQLLDLPVLENILESPTKKKENNFRKEEDLIISNIFLDREITCSLNLPQLDKWLCAAVECLEYFPDELIVMVSQQLLQICNEPSDLNLHKKILFDVIVKYYNQARDPILTNRYYDVHSGIIELLENDKRGEALESLQLYLKLLVPNIQEELRRLLTFMDVASELKGYKLQKQFDNRSVVIRSFSKAILQDKGLSKTQSEQLIQILMENHLELFKTPLTLLELISKKLKSFLTGHDPDVNSGFTFCQHLTPEEYEEQKTQTSQHLQQLIQEMDSDTAIPFKQKKKLLKEFQKHHSLVLL